MKKNFLVSLFLLFPLLALGQSLEIKPDKKGKLGYFDSDGNKVISCQYEEAEPFVNGVARVRKNGKYGLINEKGKAVGGLKYTVMDEYAGTGYYIVCDGGSEAKPKDKISTRVAIPAKIFKGSTYYPIKGGKWGVVDAQGNVLIKAEYDELSNPIKGAIYVTKGGKVGFYNEDMELVLKPTYNFMGAFNNQGLCWVKNGGKFTGKYVKGGKMSVIDRTGKLIVPLKFESVCTFTPSGNPAFSSMPVKPLEMVPFLPMSDSDEPCLWFASKGIAKPGVVDIRGNVLLPEKKYDVIYMPTDGMLKFSSLVGKKPKVQKWGYFNIETKKEVFTDPEYVFYPFNNGISKAARNDSCLFYFVDKDFHEISERYVYAGDFVEDYCAVGRGGKFGALDRSGKEVIPLEYENLKTAFSEGLLGAKKDGKWGFVSPDNQVKIPFMYDKVASYKKGCVSVCLSGKWGQIDTQNNVILPIEWDNFLIPDTLPARYYWVEKSDKLYYYYDMATHKISFPSEGKGFTEVELFAGKEYARVKSSLYYGAVRQDGTEYVPCKFEKKSDVEKAIFYLQKNKLPYFKEVDLKRFHIILRGTSNQHKLSERIPNEDWDY